MKKLLPVLFWLTLYLLLFAGAAIGLFRLMELARFP